MYRLRLSESYVPAQPDGDLLDLAVGDLLRQQASTFPRIASSNEEPISATYSASVRNALFVNPSNLPVETRAIDGNTVVNWWTLLENNNDTGVVMGIAEIPVDAHRPSRGHLHPQG